LLEGFAVGGPDVEGGGNALELFGEARAVEERFRAEMAQLQVALVQLGEIGGIAFVAPGAGLEQVTKRRAKQEFAGRIMRQMPQ
jgi:hypothetical protein